MLTINCGSRDLREESLPNSRKSSIYQRNKEKTRHAIPGTIIKTQGTMNHSTYPKKRKEKQEIGSGKGKIIEQWNKENKSLKDEQ